MADTATKQRIPGDLDDRVDELEERINVQLAILKGKLIAAQDAIRVLRARLDKLEAWIVSLAEIQQTHEKTTAVIQDGVNSQTDWSGDLAARIAALEQDSGLDIDMCVVEGERGAQ